MMRRWFSGLLSALAVVGVLLAPPSSAGDAPIGHLGDTLRVTGGNIAADVTAVNVLPAALPPGWASPPRWPRQEVWRAQITVTAVSVPAPYSLSPRFAFRGVTQT